MNKKQAKRAEAIETLRGILNVGDNIRCNVLHVSRSGMSRSIELEVALLDENGRPYIREISWLVAVAIGERFDDKRGGVVVTGCGMDMCFAAVYNLGRVLFPDGFGLIGVREAGPDYVRGKKRRATSPKHAAQLIRYGYRFRGRNGDASGWDRDGGYALGYRG